MHGKAKVKTSVLEAEKKKREREIKVNQYKKCMSQILDKKVKNELDENAMTLINKLLESNPDIYSLWNMKRRILQLYLNSKEKDELETILRNELRFTEHGLKINPKSYCCWHQREWLIDNFPHPDLKRELNLCTMYLKLDERNFHCWDYRRFIAQKLNVPPQDELSYTMDKINENFSNYSSWHYRSKLLPRTHPDPNGILSIDESALVQELDLVVNAAFTDPGDQSAWFYLRWLLGQKTSYPKPVTVLACDSHLYVAFSGRVLPGDLKFKVNNVPLTKCLAISPYLMNMDLPSGTLPTSLDVMVQDRKFTVNLTESEPWRKKWSDDNYNLNELLPARLVAGIRHQLESCNSLIEVEPQSKWALLTSIHLMMLLEKNSYRDVILHRLNILESVDLKRSRYYNDLKSEFLMEEAVIGCGDEFRLVGAGLTSLSFTHLLLNCVTVDLSSNNLDELALPHLRSLQSCKVLILRDNVISCLAEFPLLSRLEVVSFNNNRLSDGNDIYRMSSKMISIKEILISGNPIITGLEFLKTLPYVKL